MMNTITEYQKGFKYTEEIRNAVLFGYMYRKESERYEDSKIHYKIGDISEPLLWLAGAIASGLTWDFIKANVKLLYQHLIKKGALDKISELVFTDEKQLKEFYNDIKEFNEHSMNITEKQFEYIREEIEANVVGEELGRIFSREKREPSVQEIMEAYGKARKKSNELLGSYPATT